MFQFNVRKADDLPETIPLQPCCTKHIPELKDEVQYFHNYSRYQDLIVVVTVAPTAARRGAPQHRNTFALTHRDGYTIIYVARKITLKKQLTVSIWS